MDSPAGGSLTSNGYAWQNATILGGGFVSGIEFSPAQPDLIYARTDVGGAYRWDATAQHWAPLTDWVGRDNSNLTGIESIAPDPVDPNVVYLAAGEYVTGGNGPMNGSILRSADMGSTWAQSDIGAPMGGNVDGRNMGERLAIDPNLPSTLYFGSRTSGLWTSTDSATTWSSVSSFPVMGTAPYGLTFVFFDKRRGSPGTATSTIYVGVTTSSPGSAGAAVTSTAPSLYRSIDSGATWQPVPGQPTSLFPHHAAMDYAAGVLYFTFNDGWGPGNVTTGAVWKLDTSGDSWTNVSPPRKKGGFGGVTVDSTHSGTAIVTTLDRWPDEIYRTTNGGGTNGGANWTAIGTPATRDVAGARWLFWGGTMLSSTAWNGWMGDIEIDPHNPARVLYNTGQGIWWSDDATGPSAHWKFQDQGLEETVPASLISPSGGAHLLSAVGDIGGFLHADLTVSPLTGMFSNPVFGNTTSIDFAEQHPAVIARVGTTSSSVAASSLGAYSTDGGATWNPFSSAPTMSASAGSIAVSADGATFVWAPQAARGATSPPAYSGDRGTTWTPCNGLPSGTRVASDRVNPRRFYAAGGGMLYASADGGATFAVLAALPGGGATVRPTPGIEGDLWLASGGGGLYHRTDSSPILSAVGAVQNAASVGFGRAATCQSPYPVLYLAGAANGVSGVYRSDDQAATWQRIDDPQHQYGTINCVTGDPRVYGRVYLGTGGRGILYGDPQ
ncbi:MAG TPA: xyloglucanase [Polyangiaceae bacterium]|nr:xyloglucanase [Polyangiaceae bacterium]